MEEIDNSRFLDSQLPDPPRTGRKSLLSVLPLLNFLTDMEFAIVCERRIGNRFEP